MGLLSKTIELSKNSDFDFYNFITKHNLDLCGIFSKFESLFLFEDCFGLDGSSIFSCESTCDFWNGTIAQKDKFYYFSKDDSFPFYQFFSFNQKDKISNVSVYFSSKINKILFICNNENYIKKNEIQIIKDFESIVSSTSTFNTDLINKAKDDIITKYEINFGSTVENFLTKCSNSISLKKHFSSLIYKEIFYILRKNFSYPSCVVKVSDTKYKILFYTKNELPLELFINHLKHEFSKIIYDDSNLILIQKIGTCQDKENAINFIQVK